MAEQQHDPIVIGIFAHVGKDRAAHYVAETRASLEQSGVKVILEDQTSQLLGEGPGPSVPELNQQCSAHVVLGGDGTILSLIQRLGPDQEPRPIIGVNLGRLGFLTAVSREDCRRAVELIAQRCPDCYVRRLMLQVTIKSKSNGESSHFYAINEVTFTRGVTPRLIQLETKIDGELLTCFNADGLIIATPTGSTAYGMAAGGPILSPELSAMVVTPICPHVLSNRSVVVDARSVLTVRPYHDDPEVYVTVDGQNPLKINSDQTVEVRRSPYDARLAMLPETSFYNILRQKLKWSGSNV